MKNTVTFNPETQTIAVTIAGKTKDVSVKVWEDGRMISQNVEGVCQHRTGKKLYPVRLMFYPTTEPNKLTVSRQYCCINKQARLIGWYEAGHALITRR